jgi:hypothetical protein
MGSIEKRLDRLELATGSSYLDWELVVEIVKGGSRTYALNKVTGEKDEGHYLSLLLKDKRRGDIEVVIGRPATQSIEYGGYSAHDS